MVFEVKASVFLSHTFNGKDTNVTELCNLVLKEVEANQQTWYHSGSGMDEARPPWEFLKHSKGFVRASVSQSQSYLFLVVQ